MQIYWAFLIISSSTFIFDKAAYAEAQGYTWSNIRDGVVYIRQDTRSSSNKAVLEWSPAWLTDSHEEIIYFQSPKGDLLLRQNIPAFQTKGMVPFYLNMGDGDYRIEIPGFSFRYYSIHIDKSLHSVFEPSKIHFSSSIPRGQILYFQVPSNRSFQFCGKYHGGINKIKLQPLRTDRILPIILNLTRYSQTEYSTYDAITIPAQPEPTIWQLTCIGSGKVGFWLDDIPNLFAQNPDHLFYPDLKPGESDVEIKDERIGTSPKIGSTLPFASPPPNTHQVIEKLNLQSGNIYFFENILTDDLNYDIPFLSLYKKKFNIDQYVSILAKTERRNVIENIHLAESFLERYLAHHKSKHDIEIPYIAFADEPNLNYPDYETFENHFKILSRTVQRVNKDNNAHIKIASPESSLMTNGPTREDSKKRTGFEWTERLLKKYPDSIDSISWHLWLKRDLIATEWYNTSIESVSDLSLKYPLSSQKNRDLIISQTNISSGMSLSPYEQETFFAALWWASVVSQSASTGKLHMLNWFKLADDGKYNKGLVRYSNGNFILKPVGHATSFINKSILSEVLYTKHDSVELDLVATTDKMHSKIFIFGVNKFPRSHKANFALSLPQSLFDNASHITITCYSLDKHIEEVETLLPFKTINPAIYFELNLNPETIFNIQIVGNP
ncbi:MAG: hypothetical protein KJ737_12465 [Proteobacteria bacterium]|nr:hypothetical protein [Pseudomonadota bacterium]